MSNQNAPHQPPSTTTESNIVNSLYFHHLFGLQISPRKSPLVTNQPNKLPPSISPLQYFLSPTKHKTKHPPFYSISSTLLPLTGADQPVIVPDVSMSILNPFQLLELNVISAQDLAPVSRSMRTYAVAWVHPDRKLSTRVDTQGHNNPTWNDKFVFRVDEEFLRADTSAVMIEIYALHWFKDVHVGTVRILVGNLIPPPPRLHQFTQPQPQVGMRFVALQVRRASGRPQGILNIGVALLHSSMRSMPLYSQLSTSAIGYRNLMGEEELSHNRNSNANNQSNGTPKLRRSKSDTSSTMGSELRGSEMMGKTTKSKASSMVNGSEFLMKKKKKGRSKASSMISGKKGDQNMYNQSSNYQKENPEQRSNMDISKPGEETPNSKYDKMPYATPLRTPQRLTGGTARVTPMHEKLGTPSRATPRNGKWKYSEFDYTTPRKSILGGGVFLTESELGPSPSEVAAQMASQKTDDNESSIVGGLSLNGSVEGLHSKLERWRTELPPVYDLGELSSSTPSEVQNSHRHSDSGGGGGGGGLFSCFSNICGCECSIVCGGSPKAPKKSASGRVARSPSAADDVSFG